MRVKPKQIVQVLSISERQPEVAYILDDIVTFKAFFNLDVQPALESGLVVCDYKILTDKKIETKKLKVSSLESRFALSTASKRKSASIRSATVIGKIDITQHISAMTTIHLLFVQSLLLFLMELKKMIILYYHITWIFCIDKEKTLHKK